MDEAADAMQQAINHDGEPPLKKQKLQDKDKGDDEIEKDSRMNPNQVLTRFSIFILFTVLVLCLIHFLYLNYIW